MNTAKRPTLARIAACTALGLLVTATTLPALADSSHQPLITQARPEGAVLHILGFNFGGGTPSVTLGGLPLALAFATATSIGATLPAMAPGTYLLTLAIDSRAASPRVNDDGSKYDEFWVTIGAVGPQGPAGLDGLNGATGSVGPPGPAGPFGSTGAQGPAGPSGPQGATGATGAQGAIGASGAQGLAGPPGSQGPTGLQGVQGVPGQDGAKGSSGTDGATGPAGPPGPQGLPGSGGSPFAIESLAGVPCTVAMCSGTTAATFDRISSFLVLSCVTIPGVNTLRIQGTLAVSQTIPRFDVLSFTSDVQGFSGEIPHLDQSQFGVPDPIAIDVRKNSLCSGRAVVVTVTRTRTPDFVGQPSASLRLDGGSCANAPLNFSASGKGMTNASVTCDFTMNGNQTLTFNN